MLGSSVEHECVVLESFQWLIDECVVYYLGGMLAGSQEQLDCQA